MQSVLIFCTLQFAGPILRFPMIHIDVALHEFSTRPGTSLAMVSACAAQCVGQAVKEAHPVLLEPMMKMEVTMTQLFK